LSAGLFGGSLKSANDINKRRTPQRLALLYRYNTPEPLALGGALKVTNKAVNDLQTARRRFQRGVPRARHDTLLACLHVYLKQKSGSGGGWYSTFARDTKPMRPLMLIDIGAVNDDSVSVLKGFLQRMLALTPEILKSQCLSKFPR
jgi:hypothetical protein